MLPSYLMDKLNTEYKDLSDKILMGYQERLTSLRLNTLKEDKDIILEELKRNGLELQSVTWYSNAYIVLNKKEDDIKKLDAYNNGLIYLQSLSSMLPVLALSPKDNEHILDMCAAPGSKTTQIAMETNNKVRITACEKNKIRADRLKYNLKKQGVTCTTILMEDARYLDPFFSFDKILLDAPCSGSGTLTNPDSNNDIFTEERITKITNRQLELLHKALSLLKKDQTMIYSTCSILKEENEDIIKKVMQEYNIELLPIELNISKDNYLPSTLDNVITICPNKYFEGFFIAKIHKL